MFAVAWILIGLAIPRAVIVAVILDADIRALDGTAPYTGTVGTLSVLALAGAGYSEYHQAMASVASKDAP